MLSILPPQAEVNKFIPKNTFFKKTLVNTKQKQAFADSIARITWKYKLAESTINIVPTELVEEIEIFDIELKHQEIPQKVLRIIDKTIPYPILYQFRYMGHTAYGITLKESSEQRYYFSNWDEPIELEFTGTNLEQVYQKIVKAFIDTTESDHTFHTLITLNKQKDQLQKEIQVLENKVRKEKQFNKQLVLHKELEQKRKDLQFILESL